MPSQDVLRSSSEQATLENVIRTQRSESVLADASRITGTASVSRHVPEAAGNALYGKWLPLGTLILCRKLNTCLPIAESQDFVLSSGRPLHASGNYDNAAAIVSPAVETPSLTLKRKRGVSPYYDIPVSESKPVQDDQDPGSDELADQDMSSQPGSGRRMGRSQQWSVRTIRPDHALAQNGYYSKSPTARRSIIGRRSNMADRTRSWTNEQASYSEMESAINHGSPLSVTNAEGAEDDRDFVSELQEYFSRANSIAPGSSNGVDGVGVQEEAEDEDEADILGREGPVFEDQEQEMVDDAEEEEDEIGPSAVSPFQSAASQRSSRAPSVAEFQPGFRQGSKGPQTALSAPPRTSRPNTASSQVTEAPAVATFQKAPPAPRSRPVKQQRRPDASAALRLQAATNNRRRKGAQVLVYRLPHIPPESKGENADKGNPHANGEDGEDEDVLQTAPKFIRRPGVNAIDVLNQLFRELIESQIESIRDTPPPPPPPNEDEDEEDEDDKEAHIRQHKALTKRKIKAIESFAHELEERNFQLTECLDANHALDIRVRQAQREKQSLRDRLIHVRRQRDGIAQNIDAVKRRTQEKTLSARKHELINGGLQEIELAVKRGRLKAASKRTGNDGRGDLERSQLEFWLTRFAGNLTTSSTGLGPGGEFTRNPLQGYQDGDQALQQTENDQRQQTQSMLIAPDAAGPDTGTGQLQLFTNNTVSSGGILQRVKEFNLFLERSLSVL